ncbi:MAG TPA: hypothetical protein VGR54_09665 [Nitrosopumilaceae archaeon]|nr:hypothetical protein [Nitrosopumilaceae archaeon]
MIDEESRENPLIYNLCMAMTFTDLIRVKNKKMLDTESMGYLSGLEKSLAEIREQLLDLILDRNPQIMN